MKPRARRVTLAAVVLGAGVVGVFVVLNWRAVCDHVEAWRFQLTSKTAMIRLGFGDEGNTIQDLRTQRVVVGGNSHGHIKSACEVCDLLQLLCRSQDDLVIADSQDLFQRVWWSAEEATLRDPLDATPDLVRRILVARGWRVLEQRFPRRAYVVIRDEQAPPYVQDLEVNNTGVIPRIRWNVAAPKEAPPEAAPVE
jgi:hypothetical protein